MRQPRIGWAAGVAGLLLLTVGGHNLLLSGQLGLEVVVGVWLATGLATPGGPALGRGRTLLDGAGWPAAVGLALALTKPQTGLPLLIALLVLGAWRTVVRGVSLAVAVATPAVLVLVAIEGGPGDLIRVLRANASYASDDSTLALHGGAGGIRVDLVGAIDRATGQGLPAAAQLVVAGLSVGLVLVAVRSLWGRGLPLRPGASLLIGLALLLALVHSVYDQVLLTAPLAALLGALLLDRAAPTSSPPLARSPAVLACLLTAGVLVHAHSAADHFIGLADGPSELLDVCALMAAGVLVVIARLTRPRSETPRQPGAPSAVRPA